MAGKAVKIANGVFWVGAKDPNRKSFDALVPLPDGTTYNAYVVKGKEKTALLDTVDPTKLDQLLANLDSVESIDYVVSHHAEQDHSGSIATILERYPKATVITSAKGKAFLMDLLHLDEKRISTVGNGDKLPLGGKTLEFVSIPWSHWPETMASFLQEDGILFPCDLFGSHLSNDGLYEKNTDLLERSAKRYYAEIMMPYAAAIANHLAKLKKLHPALIAPSHGPLYDNPAYIFELYEKWIHGHPRNLVLIPHVSMHGSTTKMTDYLADNLRKKGVDVKGYDLETFDLGQYAMDLVDAATIVFAGPTVLGGMHPLMSSTAFITNILKPKARWIGLIGSYGWGGHMPVQLRHTLDEVVLEFLNPVLSKGLPRPEDYGKLDILADVIAFKHGLLTSPASPSPEAKG